MTTIRAKKTIAEWMASTLVPGATFKIKLAYVKALFQLVHGFLDAKSVSKDNVKLFCVEFASQVSLEIAFLVELTSSVHLATLKIAKFLVISESGSLSAAVALHDVPLGVSAANIKTAFSVFGSVTYIVLKPAGVWQYMVVYFEKLDSAVTVLNHWSVLVGKDSVRILSLVNQNETILSYDKFKAKLINLSSGYTAFEISNMIFQVGGWTCFIPHSLESGHRSQFALVRFGSQADLDSAIVKTSTLRKCHIWWETSGFGSSANSFGSILASLETCLNAKKNHLDSVYSHNASHKKPRKSAAGIDVINLSAGSLSLENMAGANGKPAVS
ncbi:hypothetical protein G9A89_014862 [Geosiphon pyriformis]|nr:hypothetical protein G9A89_014862 [Geosiphon pyriformis]